MATGWRGASRAPGRRNAALLGFAPNAVGTLANE